MRTAAAGAKKKGMTQQQLARQLGISKSAVGNYETGVSMPREDVLLRLFSALDAEPNYLFQDSFRPGGGVLSSGEQRLVQRYRALSAKGKAAVNTVLDAVEEKARRFGGCVADAQAGAAHSTVCFACGGGLCFSGAGRGIRDDRRRRGGRRPIAVRICGDSMEPHIPDGSIVYVGREPLQNGDVGIFCVDGDTFANSITKTHLESCIFFPSTGRVQTQMWCCRPAPDARWPVLGGCC